VGRALSEGGHGDPLTVPIEDDHRARAIALLQATHQFPTRYPVSIICVNADEVVAQVRAAVEEGQPEPLSDDTYETVMSKGGRYSSHRFQVPCQDAEAVLALHERLRRITGVKTVL
jgi:putative lipoic acid-binding regulatory protein